jgi:hypothetical protein
MNIVIDAVQFSDDGVTITYANIDEALRDEGMLMKQSVLHVSSRHHDYDLVRRVERLLEELIEFAESAYRDQKAFDPSQAPKEEEPEEEELGGKWDR